MSRSSGGSEWFQVELRQFGRHKMWNLDSKSAIWTLFYFFYLKIKILSKGQFGGLGHGVADLYVAFLFRFVGGQLTVKALHGVWSNRQWTQWRRMESWCFCISWLMASQLTVMHCTRPGSQEFHKTYSTESHRLTTYCMTAFSSSLSYCCKTTYIWLLAS